MRITDEQEQALLKYASKAVEKRATIRYLKFNGTIEQRVQWRDEFGIDTILTPDCNFLLSFPNHTDHQVFRIKVGEYVVVYGLNEWRYVNFEIKSEQELKKNWSLEDE